MEADSLIVCMAERSARAIRSQGRAQSARRLRRSSEGRSL